MLAFCEVILDHRIPAINADVVGLVVALFGRVEDLIELVKVLLVQRDLLSEVLQSVLQVEVHLGRLMLTQRLVHFEVIILLHHKIVVLIGLVSLVWCHVVEVVLLWLATLMASTRLWLLWDWLRNNLRHSHWLQNWFDGLLDIVFLKVSAGFRLLGLLALFRCCRRLW